MKKSQLIKLINELLIEDFLGEEYVKGKAPQDWEERDWELYDEGLSSNEKDIVDDILSDLSEGVVNTVLNKMLNYAKKGVLTLAIVSSVVQGLQAQDIPQNDIDQIQQKGTELVQQVVRTDKHTENTFKKHLNNQDIKKIQDYAEENNWLYTALKGPDNKNMLDTGVINKLKKYVAKSQPYKKDIKYYDAVDGGKVVVFYFTYTPASSSNENYADGKVKEGTGGADTAWIGADDEKITLQDILNLTKNIKVVNYPTQKLAKVVLNWDNNPEEIERISQVTVSSQYPILIMVDEQNKIQWILDGNHRAQKALRSKAETIPAKLIKPSDLDAKAKKILLGITENYADGKVKGKSRPGRVKRSGASCKGSVSSLRAKAKKYGGEKGKMYHWCANMKGGKSK